MYVWILPHTKISILYSIPFQSIFYVTSLPLSFFSHLVSSNCHVHFCLNFERCSDKMIINVYSFKRVFHNFDIHFIEKDSCSRLYRNETFNCVPMHFNKYVCQDYCFVFHKSNQTATKLFPFEYKVYI